MFRYISCTLCCVASVAVTSVADAQIVRLGRFGGVRVRAPFVSVDVLPYGGGTRVRAPFTSVNTGMYGLGYRGFGYRNYYYQPYGPVPPYPALPAVPAPVYPVPVYPQTVHPESGYVYPQANSHQVARPAFTGSLPDRLRASAQQLIRSLSARRDDSDVWLQYLGPNRIIETIQSGESPDSLRKLLANYDGVIGNAGLSAISRAAGFRETHQLLRAFIESPPAATSEPAQAAPSDVDAVPSPPTPDAGTNQPAPAEQIKPADDAANKDAANKDAANKEVEELPVPPPVPTPL